MTQTVQQTEGEDAQAPKAEHDPKKYWHEWLGFFIALCLCGGGGADCRADDPAHNAITGPDPNTGENGYVYISCAITYLLFWVVMVAMAFFGRWYDKKYCPHHERAHAQCSGGGVALGLCLMFSGILVAPVIAFALVTIAQVVAEIIDFVLHFAVVLGPVIVVNILCRCCSAATYSEMADMKAEIKFNRRKLGTAKYYMAYAGVYCKGLCKLPCNMFLPQRAPTFWNALFLCVIREPGMRSVAAMWFLIRVLIVLITNPMAGLLRMMQQLKFCWDQKQRLSHEEYGACDPWKIKILKMQLGLPAIALEYPGFNIPGMDWAAMAPSLPQLPLAGLDMEYLKFLGINDMRDFWTVLPQLPLDALPSFKIPNPSKFKPPSVSCPDLPADLVDLPELQGFKIDPSVFSKPEFSCLKVTGLTFPMAPPNLGAGLMCQVLCDGAFEALGAFIAIPLLLLEANHLTNLTINRVNGKEDPVTRILAVAKEVQSSLEQAKKGPAGFM